MELNSSFKSMKMMITMIDSMRIEEFDEEICGRKEKNEENFAQNQLGI